MVNALITGITGQDGAYLSKFLIEKGYEVYGLYRRNSNPNFWRLNALGVKIELIQGDLTDPTSLTKALEISMPDEVYNLGAQSHVGASFEQPLATAQATGMGVLNLLEVIRMNKKDAKVYQAGSSEMFGNSSSSVLCEDTPMCPASPYAAAKLFGYNVARLYREAYGMFVSNGILFNHESPLRGLEFVTRKITNEVARIKLGLSHSLELGNIFAKRDWGYAPEYVEAMWLMLQDSPDDYVIATKESHSVDEFMQETFKLAGLEWQKYVSSNGKHQRPLDVRFLLGDYTKARNILQWRPTVKFKELVKIMYEADLKRWQDALNGDIKAWEIGG